MKLQVSLLGMVDYKEALDIQKKILSLRKQNLIDDTLLLLQHPNVLTVGRRGGLSNILASKEVLDTNSITIYEIDRGGDVTYHGPGQIVGYPILDLNNYGRDIHEFVRQIEEIFIRLLQEEYNIIAARDPKYTGVWVKNDKITAMGFAVKKWVTMHGFAFNVNTNLENFKLINPCGIIGKGVTSLEKLSGYSHDIDKVIEQVVKYFSIVFDVQIEFIDKCDLYKLLGSDLND